ncbi:MULTISPECIES: MSMEG_1061 family FMN-dependent PPOX-type flavoprotein [Marinomonas]|uniref:Pyridoxamine 5'-phosphate oxidase family protein n=1 Tax=Marinomonas arctica TaxID=383750 RepID=A0A7H1J4T3_9GAMM|nr:MULTISPECIES: MSMEG_1061 family FMN-dependent PPOX-type flavoprotein [Marinomonas]MCS7487404.1 phosphohydrolase [Marinomonas sp. BSi20414]QNT05499.1 pyridoxamine 5'-phosphate oxidase family protein [Marinomonas arctica]GGN33223.1 hypothetical protein GCM10011350_28430 [Marinomonas arctica]
MSQITSLEQLEALYDQPHPLAVSKEITELEQHAVTFIKNSPFVLISTTDKNGFADISPRGGEAGFIRVLDSKTLAFADSAGNNRLDSLKNLVTQPEMGLLFMIPGIGEVVRAKGIASLHRDEDLLSLFSDPKPPKLVVKIHIEKILFHCPKAIAIAKLWNVESHVDRALLPSLLRIIQDQTSE